MFYPNREMVGGSRREAPPAPSTLALLEDCGRAENRAAGRKLHAILGHITAARLAAEPDEESQDWAVESAEAEIGLALQITPTTAGRWVRLALDLDPRLPGVLRALEAGTTTLPKARVLLEETQDLDAEILARLEAELLAKATGRTACALRRITRRAVLRLDADAAVNPGPRRSRNVGSARSRPCTRWPTGD